MRREKVQGNSPSRVPLLGDQHSCPREAAGAEAGGPLERKLQHPAFLRAPSDSASSGDFVGHESRTALCLQIAGSQRGAACPMTP